MTLEFTCQDILDILGITDRGCEKYVVTTIVKYLTQSNLYSLYLRPVIDNTCIIDHKCDSFVGLVFRESHQSAESVGKLQWNSALRTPA